MHTKDKLAAALSEAGLPELAKKAATGFYDDYLSPVADNIGQLAADLAKAGTPAALALRQRAINGDFDGTSEESEAWAASPEGQRVFGELAKSAKRKRKLFRP